MQPKTIWGECATETLLYKSIFLCVYVNFFFVHCYEGAMNSDFSIGKKRVSTCTNGGLLVYLSAMLF